MDKVLRNFLTDVVKPWDELNSFLSKPFAFQPEVCDVTRLANSLAVALKHTAELSGAGRGETDRASIANCLMSDVADAWKHGGNRLKDPSRHNSMSVRSRFEFLDNKGFRFLRNRVVVDHATLGSQDFMLEARDVIQYWLSKFNASIRWSGDLLVGPQLFRPSAVLFYDASKQIGMDPVRLETVQRAPSGKIALADCPEVRFLILDFSDGALANIGAPLASDEQL